MKKLLFIAALALAACGQMPWASHASTTSTATTTTASVGGKVGDASTASAGKPGDAVQTAEESGAKPDDNYSIVGLWGDNGDCKNYILIRENGTFHSYTGGEGNWTMNSGTLTLSGGNGSFPMGVRWVDADHVDLVNPNGAIGHSQRCPDNGVQ